MRWSWPGHVLETRNVSMTVLSLRFVGKHGMLIGRAGTANTDCSFYPGSTPRQSLVASLREAVLRFLNARTCMF